MIDVYSRYASVKRMINIKAKMVAKKFEDICYKLTKKYGLKMFHMFNCEIKALLAEALIGKLKVMVQ